MTQPKRFRKRPKEVMVEAWPLQDAQNESSIIKPGDWIVRDILSKEIIHILSPDIFEATYEPVTEEQE
jgi:hypothetical protein